MALSNWDTLAIDLDSKPIAGSFTSPLGVQVAFYKNWLYVYDAKAWRKDSGYSEPCVMNVNEGELVYLDVQIRAIRGPQQGVFAVVTSGSSYGKTLQGMVGCGVYGFKDETWVGVNEESVKFLRHYLDTTDEFDQKIRGVKLDGALRYNQGDMYFAANAGMDPQATKPGDAKEPQINKMIRGLHAKEDSQN